MNQESTHDDHQPRDKPEKYLRLLDNTKLGEQLSTPAGRRTALYDMLAGHPDPMWREMGEQMRNGQMRPADIFGVPAYREHVLKGLEQAKERHQEMFGAVEQAAAGNTQNPDEASDLPDATPPEPTTSDGARPPAQLRTAQNDVELDELPINWVRR